MEGAVFRFVLEAPSQPGRGERRKKGRAVCQAGYSKQWPSTGEAFAGIWAGQQHRGRIEAAVTLTRREGSDDMSWNKKGCCCLSHGKTGS